jgi:hypothetical protein
VFQRVTAGRMASGSAGGRGVFGGLLPPPDDDE